jgi:hypothetical protein
MPHFVTIRFFTCSEREIRDAAGGSDAAIVNYEPVDRKFPDTHSPL